MTFTIHRGAKEIGGSCVEVCTDSARVVVDFGMPLVNDDGTPFDSRSAEAQSREQLLAAKVLPNIPALYGQPDNRETAILISHAHGDHCGLLKYVDAGVPVYLSEVSKVLIETNAGFTGKECPVVKNPRCFEEDPEKKRRNYKSFTFGNIEITPYIMDHAVPGAFAFLIKAEGKSLFYTGDFRSHGRKYTYFYRFVQCLAPKNVDWLLMEGTILSRDRKRVKSEAALEQQFVNCFKTTQGITLVDVSSHNIDRLVSIYRACRKCGKLFVVDLYVAAILKNLAEFGLEVPHPSKDWDDVKVFYPFRLCRQIVKAGKKEELIDGMSPYQLKKDKISARQNGIVMIVRPGMTDIAYIKNLRGGALVFSKWEGYKKDAKTKKFFDDFERMGFQMSDIHTSGHADTHALQRMVEAVQPKEIVPIHTLEPGKYQELFPGAKVRMVKDGETVNGDSVSPAGQAAAKTPLDLLDHIMEIHTLHEKCGGLPETVLDNAKESLNFVCGALGLSPIQAVLFSDVFGLYYGSTISLKKLADLMKCKPALLLKYNNDFCILEAKNLVVHSTSLTVGREKTFELSPESLESIPKGKCPENPWTQKLSADDFLGRIGELCEKPMRREEDYEEAIKKMALLLEYNTHLDLVKNLASYALNPDDSFIVLRFCHCFVDSGCDGMSLSDLENIYSKKAVFGPAKRLLQSGEHILQRKQIIEYANSSGFVDTEDYRLTGKAKELLLSEFEGQISKRSSRGLIKAESISPKEMVYSAKTAKQVEELTAFLCEEKFQEVQKNLTEEKMRMGFACLFSGVPGTGKTETVYQIARKTGRDIMLVDIAELKSKWFGESEKKIKEIFTRYRAVVKNAARAPILLFNEADAIISKRRNLESSNSGSAQTENAMQNILLQEMENLTGILIATTNLVQNMDKAFERRFLYKIVFEKPDVEGRKAIWREFITDLPENDIARLAADFNFSGGQIENIARRRIIAAVLNGSAPSLEETHAFCEEEQSGGETVRRIGFGV